MVGNQFAFLGNQGGRMAMYYRARQLTVAITDCQMCGAQAEVTHHVDENWRNNDRGNLQRLCRRCHIAHHRSKLLTAKRLARNPFRGGTRAERALVNRQLREAVYAGRINKPAECSSCGTGGRLDGHHRDYDKPFDVVWLCRQCHANAHRVTPGAAA